MTVLSERMERPEVLVVDDTPANLTLAANILRGNYKVHLASSGRKALELASSLEPDLILLDVMMPEMDGYEVCRRLKADPATSQIPVIFLTSKSEVEDEELGFSLGAVDFIHKPISPPIVAARVKTHLQIKLLLDCMRHENAKLQGDAKDQLASAMRWRILATTWSERFGK